MKNWKLNLLEDSKITMDDIFSDNKKESSVEIQNEYARESISQLDPILLDGSSYQSQIDDQTNKTDNLLF